jgi:hypothetical protein
MIKGKSPYPFQTIALAVSFSPGLPILISEMSRLCKLHNAIALFIHIGKKTGEKQREFSSLLSENGFHDGNSRIYWENGEVANSILQICKHEVVDLLLAGASERENFSLPTGQTVSDLAKKAKCSVMVFSGYPSEGYKNITVNGIENNKNDLTLLTALYFADKEKTSELNIVEEGEESVYNDDSRQLVSPGSNLVREAAEKTKVRLNFISLTKENNSTLAEFAFKNNSDLLITHSNDHKLLIFDRISTANGVGSLLKKLPCNLLIVHSRLPEKSFN